VTAETYPDRGTRRGERPMANISDIDNCSPLGPLRSRRATRSARFSFQPLSYSRAMTREARRTIPSHPPAVKIRSDSQTPSLSYSIVRAAFEHASSSISSPARPLSHVSPRLSLSLSLSLSLVARGYKFDWHELVAARPLRDAATSIISRAEYLGRLHSR